MSEIARIENGEMVSMLERVAMSPDVDVAKLEKLLDMQERVLKRNAEIAYNEAMSEVQKAMRQIAADADNPQTRSKYASYSALDKALRPLYTEHGFSLSFDTGEAPESYVRVLCYVSHKNGHTRIHHADICADGKGAKGGDVMTKTHAAGSAMTYGMRYLLKLIFNVAIGEDDDDGNQASKPRITEEQAANIYALIEEVKANKDNFLKYLKVESIESIPAVAYESAVAALEAKRKANDTGVG